METGLLIAEADDALRWVYERQSVLLGFQVETAADGLECYSKFRVRSPEALVIDVEIPWGGGDGVLACVREDSGLTTVPAVFVTGDDPPEVLASRFGIPPEQCFQKPFSLRSLLKTISTVVAANRLSDVPTSHIS